MNYVKISIYENPYKINQLSSNFQQRLFWFAKLLSFISGTLSILVPLRVVSFRRIIFSEVRSVWGVVSLVADILA